MDDNDFSPDGGATLNFNFPYSGSEDLTNDANASITNTFYAVNIAHDILYQYGFDEASGNFQENNYGNGGADNDFVLAINALGIAENGASIRVPPDGTSPDIILSSWYKRKDEVVINSGSLSGTYSVAPSNFGLSFSTDITADLVLVEDTNDQGNSTDTHDACDTLVNTAELTGKIAVIRETSACEFDAKVYAVEQAGAIAAIVVNDTPGQPSSQEAVFLGVTTVIPSFLINQTQGEAIIDALINGETINMTLPKDNLFDSGLDNLVLVHEYVHGLTIRLTGGASNSECLSGPEQMGEGWSDWYGLMLTMTPTDTPEMVRGVGTFILGQDADAKGIRPFPYTTNTTLNPVTYADTNDEDTFSIPHGIGSIWSSILWDLTWKYIEKYGFDSDLYNGTGGNNKVIQVVTDGVKLLSCDPGFVDGRNAILASDQALTGGVDQCMIWEVFAARGVGLNASQGTSDSRYDQVEDFTFPPNTDPTLANCQTLSVDDFSEIEDFKIFPNPTENILTIKTNHNLGDVSITITAINGKIILNKKVVLSDQFVLDLYDFRSGIYFLNIKGKSINFQEKIIKF
ncbi:M36 family metallopeptidase [Aquimarina sp. RZ0]|uniref:M36 family metallopeptidase n=1 Tax=Aquimarina sp. RZ0 TaxID=2607730 RepID=UPI0011F0DF88|nr:T9SS type A sorting domain-containing protein [Aquimarina sp. RZ0]